jgi:hypothetical protein
MGAGWVGGWAGGWIGAGWAGACGVGFCGPGSRFGGCCWVVVGAGPGIGARCLDAGSWGSPARSVLRVTVVAGLAAPGLSGASGARSVVVKPIVTAVAPTASIRVSVGVRGLGVMVPAWSRT